MLVLKFGFSDKLQFFKCTKFKQKYAEIIVFL